MVRMNICSFWTWQAIQFVHSRKWLKTSKAMTSTTSKLCILDFHYCFACVESVTVWWYGQRPSREKVWREHIFVTVFDSQWWFQKDMIPICRHFTHNNNTTTVLKSKKKNESKVFKDNLKLGITSHHVLSSFIQLRACNPACNYFLSGTKSESLCRKSLSINHRPHKLCLSFSASMFQEGSRQL